MNKHIVITTINPKTLSVEKYEQLEGWHTVLVGDTKSHDIPSAPSLDFLSFSDQGLLPYRTIQVSPQRHYSRKNIGYLHAMSAGASIIFDADDDNIPYEAFLVGSFQHTVSLIPNTLFFNAYRHFTDKFIWPRGFPLDLVRDKTAYALQETEQREVGIWQYVADLDPDVDAIYRLLFDEPVTFERSEPFVLPTNVYCPINSQSTAWQPKAFPFLYLPISVSFRFTDILRGYVAQRLLWEQGLQVGFGPAQAYQERNPHNLFADLEDEVPVYLNAHKLVSILDSLTLSGKGLADLRTVYEALYENDIVQAHELASVDAWIADCRDIL